MTHATRFVAVAVLVALALCAPVQAQTPEIDALRARAGQGDARAQSRLGNMYHYGEGVPQDDAEAVRWSRLAAEQGDAWAQYNLGVMYTGGEGVPQDDAEAVRWYRLAAEQGHADAQSELGVSYRIGEGVPQDYVQAHMWLNLAASRMTGEIQETAVRVGDPHDPRPLDKQIRGRRAALDLTNTYLRLVADELTPDDLSDAQRLAREWDAAHPREP